jgi:hypothetical protein
MRLLAAGGAEDGDARTYEVQRPEPMKKVTNGTQDEPQLSAAGVRSLEEDPVGPNAGA